MLKMLKVFLLMAFVVSISTIVSANNLIIIDPKIVRVNQVVHYMLVDSKGQMQFIPDADSPRGEVLVSNGTYVRFVNNDGNALSISLQFLKKGTYDIFYKIIGNPFCKVKVK